jgi:hypothetical protein
LVIPPEAILRTVHDPLGRCSSRGRAQCCQRSAPGVQPFQAIGIFQNIPGVDLRAVGLPISFDGERPPTRLRAPTLGEHNAQFGAPQPAAGVTKESP